MRSIKFRVWSKKSNCFLRLHQEGHEYQPWICLSCDGRVMHNDNQGGFVYENQDDFEVQQFTGLKDKNGKDMYEGDVVRVTLKSMGAVAVSRNEQPYVIIGEVFYDQETCGFRVQLKNNQYCISGGDNIEIIGNLMENPNLLK